MPARGAVETSVAFDVDTFGRTGGRLLSDDLGLEQAFTGAPLGEEVLRCLQYMHDIESHTVCYLRDALVTDAHKDPAITTFLSIWNYEEHWHGEAIAKVLAAHGRASGRERVRSVRASLGRFERFRPIGFLIGSMVVPDIVAVQMAWGAVNEWTTQAGYAQLGRRAGHPVLSELLRRIMRQEGRHIDFYAGEARRRLAGSHRSRVLARLALGRYWRPVGHGVRPVEESNFVVGYLFGDDRGREAAARIDRQIDRISGLSGLRLVQGAVERALAQAPRAAEAA